MGSAPGNAAAAKLGRVSTEMDDLQSTALLVSDDGEEVRFTGVKGKKGRQGRMSVE